MGDLLTVSGVATLLGVSKDTVRNWEKAGKLTAHRDGQGHRWFDKAEVERVREEQAKTITIKASHMNGRLVDRWLKDFAHKWLELKNEQGITDKTPVELSFVIHQGYPHVNVLLSYGGFPHIPSGITPGAPLRIGCTSMPQLPCDTDEWANNIMGGEPE